MRDVIFFEIVVIRTEIECKEINIFGKARRNGKNILIGEAKQKDIIVVQSFEW